MKNLKLWFNAFWPSFDKTDNLFIYALSQKYNLLHNWELVKDADYDTLVKLISEMVDEFKQDCDKRNAKKLFRTHWDGDFFNETYTLAWKTVILNNTDTQFWVYTRVPSAARILNGIENLSLYFSTDDDNKEEAIGL